MTKTASFTVLLAVENKETDLFWCVWVVVTARLVEARRQPKGIDVIHQVLFTMWVLLLL